MAGSQTWSPASSVCPVSSSVGLSHGFGLGSLQADGRRADGSQSHQSLSRWILFWLDNQGKLWGALGRLRTWGVAEGPEFRVGRVPAGGQPHWLSPPVSTFSVQGLVAELAELQPVVTPGGTWVPVVHLRTKRPSGSSEKRILTGNRRQAHE